MRREVGVERGSREKKTDIIRIPSMRSIDNLRLSRNDSLVNAVSKGDEMRELNSVDAYTV